MNQRKEPDSFPIHPDYINAAAGGDLRRTGKAIRKAYNETKKAEQEKQVRQARAQRFAGYVKTFENSSSRVSTKYVPEGTKVDYRKAQRVPRAYNWEKRIESDDLPSDPEEQLDFLGRAMGNSKVDQYIISLNEAGAEVVAREAGLKDIVARVFIPKARITDKDHPRLGTRVNNAENAVVIQMGYRSNEEAAAGLPADIAEACQGTNTLSIALSTITFGKSDMVNEHPDDWQNFQNSQIMTPAGIELVQAAARQVLGIAEVENLYLIGHSRGAALPLHLKQEAGNITRILIAPAVADQKYGIGRYIIRSLPCFSCSFTSRTRIE